MNKTRPIYDIFDRAMSLIDKKADDYSESNDAHSNFKYALELSGPFPAQYRPYVILIGVKLARLSQLLREGKQVNNESVEDSFLDLINYTGLMAERYKLDKRDEAVMLISEVDNLPQAIGYEYCHICSREQTMCVCSKEIEPATIPLPPGFKW